MNKKDLIALANMPDDEIEICKVLEAHKGYIRFEIDKDLSLPEKHLQLDDYNKIVCKILHTEQIDDNISNVISCSFRDNKLSYISSDTLFKTFITCYGEHRPLVLSPDIIWLIIAQTIAKHINSQSEIYRKKLVNFVGLKELEVESETDLFDSKTNWSLLLQKMYNQIATKTEGNLASSIICDFSTTGINEKVASYSVLMESVKSYFKYHISHYICDIPNITLLGTPNDWKSVLEKASILKSLKLKYWYEWLTPIIKEFIRAANGKPNLQFWKSIVIKKEDRLFSEEERRSCIPKYHKIDGWCVALFPFVDNNRRNLHNCTNKSKMDNEMIRTRISYHRIYQNHEEIIPLEVWAGFVGVEENKETFALKPKIGWFVRKSNEEAESIARLKRQDSYRGIELEVDSVPEILKKLEHINNIIIHFKKSIVLPEWLLNMNIDEITVYGKISREEKNKLLKCYKNLKINKH